jgi:hypothetical protein
MGDVSKKKVPPQQFFPVIVLTAKYKKRLCIGETGVELR